MRIFIVNFILLLFCFNLIAQADTNYKITYQLTYRPDSTDLAQLKTENFQLFTNAKTSYFLSNAVVSKDSTRRNFGIGDIGSDAYKRAAASWETNFSYRIYKKPLEKLVYHCERIATDNFYYAEGLHFDWEIRQETKTIEGFSAQKATTSFAGRNYTAWFAAAIPISDGPYKFYGLPGLILEIESTDGDYTFTMIGIEKTSYYPVVNTPPKSLLKATKKEMVRLQQEFYDDPYGFLNNWVGSNGATIHIGLKGKAKQDHYAKYGKLGAPKMNNFIEIQ